MDIESTFNGAEYAVPVRAEGKNLLLRAFLVGIYIGLAIGYFLVFTVAVRMPALIAALPLLLWILIFFTWRLAAFEWQTKVTPGQLTLSKVRGKKSTPIHCFALSELVYAVPAKKNAEPRDKDKADAFIDCRPHKEAQCYEALIKKDGKRLLVIFPASLRVVTSMRRYNSHVELDKEYLHI